MSDTAPLLVTRQGAVATLRFNRPAAMNALDLPTALALRDAVQAISQDPEVRQLIDTEIATGNAKLAQVAQIRKFHLLTKELDHDDGEVTATMKVRRSSIYKTYAAEIEALYR